MSINPKTIQCIAEEFYEIEMPAIRAEEIAAEIVPLNYQVHNTAQMLNVCDEPSLYSTFIETEEF